MTTNAPIHPTTTAAARTPAAYGTEISRPRARRSTETKASLKTTELIAYVVAVVGVLLASLLVETTDAHADCFRADKAWFSIVLLTIGYLGSRGLAKSRSHDDYDA